MKPGRIYLLRIINVVDASKFPMHEGRFSYRHVRRRRVDCVDDVYRGRNKVDRPPPVDFGFGHGGCGRDGFPNKRKGFERWPATP